MNSVVTLLRRYATFSIKILSDRGLRIFLETLWHFFKSKAFKLLACFTTGRDISRFKKILAQHAGLPVIVTCPMLDWDAPLFQRPHHIAFNLSRCGFLCIYCTDNWSQDSVLGFREIAETLYVTNRADIVMSEEFRKVYLINSTDNAVTLDFVEREMAKGNLILYEYMDEIHEQISCMGVPDSTYIRHEAILSDERCMVVATADKLLQDVQAHRSRNFVMVTNGVEYEHFARRFSTAEMPVELRHLVAGGRKIIGYFGALASWFDYELVLKVARERPDYEVVLIGFDYDGSSLAYGLDREARIHVIGPVAYGDLPRYACWFDVAIIPFRINEITESTSPIKLFEYMALGKPIVTTDMPECRKYKSTLVAHSHDDFIRLLDVAIDLCRDHTYISLLKEEALANTWGAKARVVAGLIGDNLSSSPAATLPVVGASGRSPLS